jgi:hypothetical protein
LILDTTTVVGETRQNDNDTDNGHRLNRIIVTYRPHSLRTRGKQRGHNDGEAKTLGEALHNGMIVSCPVRVAKQAGVR